MARERQHRTMGANVDINNSSTIVICGEVDARWTKPVLPNECIHTRVACGVRSCNVLHTPDSAYPQAIQRLSDFLPLVTHARLAYNAFRAPRTSRRALPLRLVGIPNMELVACSPPRGPLAAAPSSALHASSAEERWEGFWGDDDAYYARRTDLITGATEWFQFGEEHAATARSSEEPRVERATRVEPARRDGAAMRVLFARGRPSGRRVAAVLWIRAARRA